MSRRRASKKGSLKGRPRDSKGRLLPTHGPQRRKVPSTRPTPNLPRQPARAPASNWTLKNFIFGTTPLQLFGRNILGSVGPTKAKELPR